MGLFDGIEEAQVHGGDYIQPGRYWVMVKAFTETENRKKNRGVAFEFEILKAYEGSESPVGSTVSHVISTAGDGADYFLTDVKKALAGILGTSTDNIKAELCNKLVEDDSSLRGRVVELIVHQPSGTKKDGTPSKFAKKEYTRVITAEELEKESITV